jgi:hypothetical protein
MPSVELVDAFERCELPNDGFHHRDHVHVIWTYLREMPLLQALERFSTALRRFAAHHGKTTLYHATITWAYAALIHERMQQDPDASWEDFCCANPDLFSWRPSILDRYYRPETLNSELARRVFVLPDRAVH